jgi:hypothetical protein
MKSPRQDERRRYLILLALRDNGGPMLLSQVYLKVRDLREKMNDPLSARELKPVGRTRKEPTYINEIRHASRLMVDDGRMTRRRHGWWEITENGREWLETSTWLVSSIVEDDGPISHDI